MKNHQHITLEYVLFMFFLIYGLSVPKVARPYNNMDVGLLESLLFDCRPINGFEYLVWYLIGMRYNKCNYNEFLK